MSPRRRGPVDAALKARLTLLGLHIGDVLRVYAERGAETPDGVVVVLGSDNDPLCDMLRAYSDPRRSPLGCANVTLVSAARILADAGNILAAPVVWGLRAVQPGALSVLVVDSGGATFGGLGESRGVLALYGRDGRPAVWFPAWKAPPPLP